MEVQHFFIVFLTLSLLLYYKFQKESKKTQEKIRDLKKDLSSLLRTQDSFSKSIDDINLEINKLGQNDLEANINPIRFVNYTGQIVGIKSYGLLVDIGWRYDGFLDVKDMFKNNSDIEINLVKMFKLDDPIEVSVKHKTETQLFLNTEMISNNNVTNETFDVILTKAGRNKLKVVKRVWELTGEGLREAKDLVDSVPTRILVNCDKTVSLRVANELEEAGAEVEISPEIRNDHTYKKYESNKN